MVYWHLNSDSAWSDQLACPISVRPANTPSRSEKTRTTCAKYQAEESTER